MAPERLDVEPGKDNRIENSSLNTAGREWKVETSRSARPLGLDVATTGWR